MTDTACTLARVQFFGVTLTLDVHIGDKRDIYRIRRDGKIIQTHADRSIAVIAFSNQSAMMLSDWTERA